MEASPFIFLGDALAQGLQGALLTITRVEGGGPRPVGTHMAVLSDGRYSGYLSGGCVEPAVAAEVKLCLARGKDELLRFGAGSPFFDIRFPCGGGIEVLVHVRPDPAMIDRVLRALERRTPFNIVFDPAAGSAEVQPFHRPQGWHGETFTRAVRPRTRLLLVGRGPELETLARVGIAADFDVVVATPDAALMSDYPQRIELSSSSMDWKPPIDPWTATVLLFHQHEWEDPILRRVLIEPGFYLGALGSRRTHEGRRIRLLGAGLPGEMVDRIRGPIGWLPQSRDPATLALSVLAEISASRAEFDAMDLPVATAAP
ncbi:XdhC family protein [Devosia sp. CN2-171]|uniref:XdhC family protein n=1 Tax=Devosia sp. CN2-171 TaxID=3400909 RepID=UPI003BF86CD4